jgi:hypothetical protein
VLTFCVLDDLGVVAFHDGHARVGGAEVDSDDPIKESELLGRGAYEKFL